MMKIEGSGSASGSISQRHGSADPDPDPHQNVMDPEHWFPVSPPDNPPKSPPRPWWAWQLRERAPAAQWTDWPKETTISIKVL
jgi:hypothetical protein